MRVHSDIKFNRIWSMPNKNTFKIKPIKELLERYITPFDEVIEPFANNSEWGTITNDLDSQYDTTYHMEATDFLKILDDKCADVILYDPPFSPRQLSECYKKFGLSVNSETTRSDYWTKQKKEIARIIKPNGIVISFGWNSGGIGKKLGFEIIEILLVPHGGRHNDTIVTVERKIAE